MIYPYVVTLRKDSGKYLSALNFFLCLFSILAFSFAQIRDGVFEFSLTAGILFLAGGTVIDLYRSKRKNAPARYPVLLIAAGVIWLFMPYLKWLIFIFFLLSFLEYQARYPLEIGFGDNGVVINSLVKRKFAWTDFNNIILKDGLLTLDFKNNRLLQKETLEDEDDDGEEEEFNAFCKLHLEGGLPV
jgi:hypothetical protein